MFGVGQKVWDALHGEGRVVEVEEYAPNYPVIVDFGDGTRISYTRDGKVNKALKHPSLYPYPVEIVKKVAKPCINWEHVDSKFKYLAEDPCGAASLYEDEPFTALNSWGIHGGEAVEAFMFASYVKGTCDWKESLVKRPTGDSHDD